MSEPARAMLLPNTLAWGCPSCSAGGEVELQEDNAGMWKVPDDERFIHCDCGAFLDIGWDGWRWHDPDAGRSAMGRGEE